MAARLPTTAEMMRVVQALGPRQPLRVGQAVGGGLPLHAAQASLQRIVEASRAAGTQPTTADLMRGILVENEASRARRFDELKQPFVFERPAGLTQKDAEGAAVVAGIMHRGAMMRL